MEYSVGCHHNMIIIDKKEKKVIKNKHTITQYLILISIYAYSLRKWDIM